MEWRDIAGWEGAYQVSDAALVRSRRRTPEWRFLIPGRSSNGYYTVALGRGNSRTLHSLVAEAFLGPCPEGQEVRHKDGNRRDSRLANLEYGTRTENINDAVRHGTWMTPARTAHLKRIGFGGRRSSL